MGFRATMFGRHCNVANCVDDTQEGQLDMEKIMTIDEVKQKVFAVIQSLLEEDKSVIVVGETRLIGDGRVMTSLKLVELCLTLEDLATEIGFVFDWTSEAAMSKSRSMFRTAGALAEEFYAQMGTNQ